VDALLAEGSPMPPVATSDRYKWMVLINTTVGVLIATIDASIVIIAMPAIFRGIGLDPLGRPTRPHRLARQL
jgi:hypothetical protein